MADSDRDMLSVYRRLMEMAGHTAETAFDGIQVLKLLGAAPFDLAVINERLPRIAHERILSALRNQGTPALVLLDRPLHVSRLCGKELANAYLTFPFFPAELSALALDVTRKARSDERIRCMGIEADVGGFRFSGTDIRLTAAELDIWRELSERATPLPFPQRVYVHALNRKLERLDGDRIRVEYLAEKGYGLVRKA